MKAHSLAALSIPVLVVALGSVVMSLCVGGGRQCHKGVGVVGIW